MKTNMAAHGAGQQLVAVADAEQWNPGLDQSGDPGFDRQAPGQVVGHHEMRTGNDHALAGLQVGQGLSLAGVDHPDITCREAEAPAGHLVEVAEFFGGFSEG